MTERDPLGKHQHESGAKLDAGKIRPALVLGGFARALVEVCKVGTYGAVKYTDNGWMQVPNGLERYDDAKLRHWLAEKCGQDRDKDTELMHAAHEAWNALARLDLLVREQERVKVSTSPATQQLTSDARIHQELNARAGMRPVHLGG